MGGENCLEEELPILTMLQVNAQSTQERLKQRAHGILTHASTKTADY